MVFGAPICKLCGSEISLTLSQQPHHMLPQYLGVCCFECANLVASRMMVLHMANRGWVASVYEKKGFWLRGFASVFKEKSEVRVSIMSLRAAKATFDFKKHFIPLCIMLSMKFCSEAAVRNCSL